MPSSQDYLLEYASSLPNGIRETLLSSDMGGKLQNIGLKNRLHVDQMDTLYAEIGSVLMGFTHPKDFPGKIARALGIGIDKAAEITKDINREIFDPVLKEIEGVYSGNQKNEEVLNTLEKDEDVTHISRGDLLSEIENPLPVGFRDTEVPARLPQEKGGETLPMLEIPPVSKTMQVIQSGTAEPSVQLGEKLKNPAPTASMFMPPEVKMERHTVSHAEETNTTPESLKTPAKSPARADPYREPTE